MSTATAVRPLSVSTVREVLVRTPSGQRVVGDPDAWNAQLGWLRTKNLIGPEGSSADVAPVSSAVAIRSVTRGRVRNGSGNLEPHETDLLNALAGAGLVIGCASTAPTAPDASRSLPAPVSAAPTPGGSDNRRPMSEAEFRALLETSPDGRAALADPNLFAAQLGKARAMGWVEPAPDPTPGAGASNSNGPMTEAGYRALLATSDHGRETLADPKLYAASLALARQHGVVE